LGIGGTTRPGISKEDKRRKKTITVLPHKPLEETSVTQEAWCYVPGAGEGHTTCWHRLLEKKTGVS